jgi:hypothetical protein
MNNTSYMKLRPLLLFLAVVSAVTPMAGAAEKSLKPDPIKWCYTTRPGIVARTKPGNDEKELVKLTRGSLQPVYEIKKTGSGDWLRIVNIDLAVMTPRSGWVKSAEVEMAEATEFPVDDKILALSGSPFLEDFIAENTAIARTILHTKSAGLVMICYMGTEVLPQTRLQLFIKSGGRFKASSYIDLPFSEMKSPLAGLEARDMLGEGDEFLVTREPYDAGPSNVGMNVLIRRLEGSAFKIVGRIPVSARNFASYPPRLDIAEPDEANIGRPGTDTKGEIEFRSRGPLTDIAWKGEIRFHALGREKPLETIPLERVWAWDGIQFSPRR